MKKAILFIGLLLAISLTANAQDISKNAIGLRVGGGTGLAGEVTYQRALNKESRLEVDFGLANKFKHFKATGLYQWVWKLEDGFNWYAGAGGGVLSADKFSIYGAGVVGLEYNFKVPVLISIDYRPELGLAGSYKGYNSDFALSVRYQF